MCITAFFIPNTQPMSEYKTIKSWAEEDRPREKLLKNGVRSLTDSELLALIIGSGTREVSAVELSRIILSDAQNSLDALSKKSVKDLMKIKGVGEAKGISIVAALELGRRRKTLDPDRRPVIKSSKDAYNLFFAQLADLPHEEIWVAFLSRSNKIIEKIRVSQGGISGTVIDNRLIMKSALDAHTSSIILCHNHPSGNLNPSQQDKDITQKLKEAAKFFDMQVLDHIIIGEKDYYSFADNGML